MTANQMKQAVIHGRRGWPDVPTLRQVPTEPNQKVEMVLEPRLA